MPYDPADINAVGGAPNNEWSNLSSNLLGLNYRVKLLVLEGMAVESVRNMVTIHLDFIFSLIVPKICFFKIYVYLFLPLTFLHKYY